MDFKRKVVEALAVEIIYIICVWSKIRDAKFLGKGKYKVQSSSVYNFLQPILE